MRLFICGILCLALVGGCGGYYTLTVPDQLAAAGGETVVIGHLARNDFFVLNLPVDEALLRFHPADARVQGAYTDAEGYAAVKLPAPQEPGRYTLEVSHSDYEGEEVSRDVPLFAWSKDKPVLAVDLDSLPGGLAPEKKQAVAALSEIFPKTNIIYMSRRDVNDYPAAHKQLKADGYPDGPIIAWERKRWRLKKVTRWNFTYYRVVMEDRMVSPLDELREKFPGLKTGLSASRLAAKAFADAGLESLVLSRVNYSGEGVTQIKSWSQVTAMIPE